MITGLCRTLLQVCPLTTKVSCAFTSLKMGVRDASRPRAAGMAAQADERVGERAIAALRHLPHFGEIADRPENLVRRSEHVLFVGRSRTRGIDQTLMDVDDVDARALEALQHVDRGDRKKREGNGQEQTKPERPAAFSRRNPCPGGVVGRARLGHGPVRADQVAP
jgi:hypothetical protein